MRKYELTFERTCYERATMEVFAASREEAEAKAVKLGLTGVNSGRLDWYPVDYGKSTIYPVNVCELQDVPDALSTENAEEKDDTTVVEEDEEIIRRRERRSFGQLETDSKYEE